VKNRTGRPPNIDAFKSNGMIAELIMIAARIHTKLVTYASELVCGFMKLITSVIKTARRILVTVEIAAAPNCRDVLTRIA
jgi:hypothetical protein